MARSRFTKPEFFDDPVLARCSHPARLLFQATWQVADRTGVFEWDVSKLRKYAFGYEDITAAQVGAMLDELLAGGFIKYAVFSGRAYGFVVNLAKHQKFHVAEKPKYEEVKAGAIWHASSKNTLPAPCQNPFPLRPSLETETETETDLAAKPTRKRKASPGASQPGRTVAVRDAWVAAWEERYPGQRAVWGMREGGQCAQLLGSYTPEELVDLTKHFFAWKRPEVIRAGHSFGKGSACFVLKIEELRADMAAPQRRAVAAQLTERERLSDTAAADADQINRIVNEEAVDAYATGSRNKSRLGEPARASTKPLGGTTQSTGGSLPWKDFGPPPDLPGEEAGPSRNGNGPLRGFVSSGGGRPLPVAATHQRGNEGPPGACGGYSPSAHDASGEESQ
jgi:hypothetical protein